MDKINKLITLVIISHKSTDKVIKFVGRIKRKINILIIDNSKDYELKKKLKKKKNIKIYFTKNNGFGSAINFSRKKIKTKYIFAFSPDIAGVDDNFIKKFYKVVQSNLKFGVLGPRYLNVTNKSHKQSNIKNKIGKIDAVNGSALFINTEAFDSVNGFDKNIFLFFEENDFCKRIINNKYNIYQINNASVRHKKGINSGVVKIKKENLSKLEQLYNWHFQWSKYYYHQKHYGKIIAIFYFIPIIIRAIFRILINIVMGNKSKTKKYIARFSGLASSIAGKPSTKRLDFF